ncbi:PREDICTED: gypsy retrotransposon integrase-like protein 1 isoform X1 [Dipodomys ordii]|uniref:Gypsy retrotransposon integrase-like protein 1 n=1 Tax=Dipodomys ordii TaxID=10020 RepID=A0A1S3FN54_DIPOR|nr:PREDICTED: gypsy retrotransposon integrase-like protein 1 isoform X1 [Dipodomys ordii]XP_012877455.1 PREDICTED: gypsy retrotransposon integrase-like protein 1 isoform X1 [Dipodomys ordii]XP_012877456.1 PREDICTED: gypsy retrotransposon integrase-like protein 1 isoform X1 [Dipodomys ordii]
MMVRSGKNGDLHLKQIAYYKRTGEYHSTTLPSERSGIRRAAKKFVFKEKKLFYVGKERKQNRLVIVSDEEKKKALRECHENDTGVHHGISRTLTLVESSYYWTSVTNDVKQWVYACQHCQVAKNAVILAPKQHILKVENPWNVITVDLMGPFHKSHRSHEYAIIMTDLFTKWVVLLPLHDTSASEISKAILNVIFLYGLPQKIIMDQCDEFIQQINIELYGLFGTKQIIISHGSGTINPSESTPSTIKTFLSRHCTEHPNSWDEHLPTVSFAFNITHLEPTKNTPYFQMFNRNPNMPETSNGLHEMDDDNASTFSRILDAIKEVEANKIMENKAASVGQIKDNNLDELNKNKIIVKKKPKQLNPFHLKVGHEVLRQRKNWWKDGRFQSEWVGPCVIDYITENGCAVLRDNTGTRLKRPIKMSHLKPYVRESNEQDSLYLLQGSVVADHDYIGLPEIPVGAYQANILVEDTTIGVVETELLTSSKDRELLEYTNSKISPLIEDHGTLDKQTFSLLDSSNQVLEYLS